MRLALAFVTWIQRDIDRPRAIGLRRIRSGGRVFGGGQERVTDEGKRATPRHGRDGRGPYSMQKRKATRASWILSAFLAAALLVALWQLGVWLRWYRIARYHG